MFSAVQLGVWMDIAQTVFLGVLACTLIYVMLLLRNEMRAAAGALNRVLTSQAETAASLERVWKRIEALENQRSDL
jgi:hypothetical protein